MRTVLMLGMILGVLGALPREGVTAEREFDVEGIRVTGKRPDMEPVYSPITVPTSAAAMVEEFDREEIRATAAANVYDIAALSPGVRLEFQGRRGMNTLMMRGGDTVGVILDGVYLPWSQASRMLAQFPVDAIESVRMVRDSSAVTLGPFVAISPAMSHDNVPSAGLGSSNQGFMVITTRRGKGFELGGSAEYGSLDTRSFQLYHGYRLGDFSYRMAGTASGTSGRSGWNNAASTLSLLVNGNYDGPALKGDFMVYYADGRREIQRGTSDSYAYTSRWYYDPLQSLDLSLNLHKQWNAVHTTSLSYSRGQVTDHEVLQDAASPTVPPASSQRDQLDSLHLWHVAATEKNRLVTGFQGFVWNSPTGQFFYPGVARKEDIFSGYIHDEYRPTGRLTIDGGVRVDAKLIEKGSDKYAPTLAYNRTISNQWQDPAISVSVGSSFKLDEVYRLMGRVGYSRQNADTFLATVDNKDPGTEQRFKYELGAEAAWHPGFNPGLTLFLYDIRNFSYAATTGGGVNNAYYIYDTADVIRGGMEATARGELPGGFGYHAGYSYITTNRSDTNRAMPHHTFSLRLSHQAGGVESNLILSYLGPYENNFLSVGGIYRPVGNYTRLDLNVSYPFTVRAARLRATLYGRNILDERYVTIAGWQDQGAVCGGKLDVSF
ncbi:TonB-dependent siderophore receptor [Geobacter sp. SVR]|uniref:TonB-dependent receptor plug domain-containing protein n=1 Tax=Geobacter sp. SVR TaxID=2495594 RepID=UPI00143EF6FC|nr:TonB-dependent receptor plug domain-containing protein [Geobacter sp. SVR]BCS55055.1 hypothetical protein GSVR_33630 [Geobacter sp. SVR]GCF85237.1 hypothetical protein GSbR_18370 [Geobacter sp. SVR]